MGSYLIKHYKEHSTLTYIISSAIHLTPEPAKFVLDVIQSLYELLESKSVSRQIYSGSCLFLSVTVMEMATITKCLKDDALKFSITWREFLDRQGVTNCMEIFSFLWFLASYKLAELYDADELLSLLGTFYTESGDFQHVTDVRLCRKLGLVNKIPGMSKLVHKLAALLLSPDRAICWKNVTHTIVVVFTIFIPKNLICL